MPGQTRLLYIYASQDEFLLRALESHLTSLAEEGFFASMHLGQLLAGTDISQQLATEVSQADIVLLILSADFMASVSCRSLLEQVQEQCASRRLLVVPILARPVDWRVTGLWNSQALPRNGKPVTLWDNQDSAWFDVAQGLRALLTGVSTSCSSKEIIDFTGERMRHETLCGREDVLAQLDQWLLGGRLRGYVLLTGGPGMGKSALINKWLHRREQAGEPVPHHFIRRGQQEWDQPAAVTRNLAAQIERIFPGQRDVEVQPASRLSDLLFRVSKNVLVPERRRLILVIDALDEAVAPEWDNPLPLFLPWALPPFVQILCALRPTYPLLGWLKARDGGVLMIDLHDKKWSRSNVEACQLFWQAQSFTPPLPASLIAQALDRGHGNLLYTVKLRDQLESLSAHERQVFALPEGLAGWLDESWQRLVADEVCWPLVERGLGLLCAAREALPVSVLDLLLGGVSRREALLRRVRSMLLEEPTAWDQQWKDPGEIAYRPYHDSFRSFIENKLGGTTAMQGFHQTLMETIASWPAAETPFQRAYVLRHGVGQRVAAERWCEVRALCLDPGYLQATIEVLGLEAIEAEIGQAARQCPEAEVSKELHEVARALRAESHWLQLVPQEVAGLVYNWLVNAGWSRSRLKPLTKSSLILTLQHPLQRRDMSERTLVGHSGLVRACVMSADGKRAVSGGLDQTLKVWDLDSGRELFTLSGHSGIVETCWLSADGKLAISGSEDKTLKVWDLDSGCELFTLSGHLDGVLACAVSADAKRVVSVSKDQTLKVWSLDSRRELFTLSGHHKWITACWVSTDGKRAVSCSEAETLKVWDLESGRELFTRSGHRYTVSECWVSADGKLFVSCYGKKTLKVWDLESGRELFLPLDRTDWMNVCGVSEDGTRAVSGGGKTLKVWNLNSGRELFVLSGHSDVVSSGGVSADGKRAVSGSHDATLKVWNLESACERFILLGHSDRVNGCEISADGKRAISGSEDMTLKVWDLDSGRELFTLLGHQSRVSACGMSADGQRAVSGSWDRPLKVWDLDSRRELFTLSGHLNSVCSCRVSENGKRAISGSVDQTLKVWDLDIGRELFTLSGHSEWVTACWVNADGSRAVSGSGDGTLKVWDLDIGRELFTLSGHAHVISACDVSADGKRAISCSWDQTLKVWDLGNGRELFTLSGHSGSVCSCRVSADGKRAVSGSVDQTLKVWDLDSGTCLGTVYGNGSFCSVAFRGSRIVAGDDVGNVWMLELFDPLRSD